MRTLPSARTVAASGTCETVSLERVAASLPVGFHELEADAEADGHRHMGRFATEFIQNRAMFHAVLACYVNGRLAGIGAMTDEPAFTAQPAWRMRRLYVHRDFRRRRVACVIAGVLLQEATRQVSTVTVHAGNDIASRFWEAIGFNPVEARPWSHEARIQV